MEKRHCINTALRLAIIFFIIKFVLDMLILCCEPMQKLFCLMLGNSSLQDTVLSGITIIMSVITLLITLLPKCILAFLISAKRICRSSED
jgi:uncharacterized membrane protein YcaP (DUF421 family)